MTTEQRNARHPLQPLVRDKHGTLRFKANSIVRYLLDNGGIDLNQLARLEFPKEDWDQLNQLIGYSHSGIPNLSEESWQAAEAMYKTGMSEAEARYNHARDELDALKVAMREPVSRLYGIHPDDLEGGA